MSVKLTIKKNVLGEMPARLHKGASLLIRKSALDAEGYAKTNIQDMGAVDTGNLLGSVQGRPTGDLSSEVTVGAEYAVYVNDGTSRMSARPFWDQMIETMQGEFEANANDLLDGLAR